MKHYPHQAMALGRPVPGAATGARSPLGRVFIRLLGFWALCSALAVAPAHALWTGDYLNAYRVPDKSLKMDGRPDSLWRAVAGLGMTSANTILFNNYSKMVLLAPDARRNDRNPQQFVSPPPGGSITLLAAYDSEALYFFFLVKATAIVNSKTLCPVLADAWKADAAEVFVDPSPWNEDPDVYHSYFTSDANNLVYGTSPKTIQLHKPISRFDSTRFYYRDRTAADKFQLPASNPAGIVALSSAHSVSDVLTVGVEMKIPFWAGAKASFAPGHSMFLAWGFNKVDSAWSNCSPNPLAYRWAKNWVNYDNAIEKPPGFRMNDSTHYDPTRSWDGWGPLSFSSLQAEERFCQSGENKNVFNANWDPDHWKSACMQAAVEVRAKSIMNLDAAGMPVPSRLRSRDVRGRESAPVPNGFRFPADPSRL